MSTRPCYGLSIRPYFGAEHTAGMGVLLGMSEYIILIRFDSIVYISLVGNWGFGKRENSGSIMG